MQRKKQDDLIHKNSQDCISREELINRRGTGKESIMLDIGKPQSPPADGEEKNQ